jgi:4-diphosphocytidyl-2-C-methyl-D-erythritol kinase
VIVFPNSKINLGLRILQKRSDGYHNLETIFYPLPLKDILEVVPFKKTPHASSTHFTISGINLTDDNKNNLCLKAYRILKKDFPHLPPVQMHLHKNVPAGAGLGGGSADSAFTLKLLNEKFDMGLSEKKLLDYASHLGSDCVFFIINKPCFATGRGELLERIDLDLSAYKFAVVNPGIHIDTGRAFLNVQSSAQGKALKEIIHQPIESWKDELTNDFEAHVFRQFPQIGEIKDKLYSIGALYASMSGSGSTLYGIFPKLMKVQLNFSSSYFVKELPGQL